MKTNDFGEIYQVVNSFGKGITPNKFLEVYVGNFNKGAIDKFRTQFRAEEVKNITAQNLAPTTRKQVNPRLKFFANFYSYSGLGIYYKAQAATTNASQEDKKAA